MADSGKRPRWRNLACTCFTWRKKKNCSMNSVTRSNGFVRAICFLFTLNQFTFFRKVACLWFLVAVMADMSDVMFCTALEIHIFLLIFRLWGKMPRYITILRQTSSYLRYLCVWICICSSVILMQKSYFLLQNITMKSTEGQVVGHSGGWPFCHWSCTGLKNHIAVKSVTIWTNYFSEQA